MWFLRRSSRSILYSGLLATLLIALAPSAGLAGNTYVVNSIQDLPDADQADNVCAASNGKCTLRAAIMQANFTVGADTIMLPPGTFQLTRPGDDDLAVIGDLDIIESLTIIGAGAGVSIVDGNGVVTGDRVFDVHETAVNTDISGITIRGGKRTATFDEGCGLRWTGGSDGSLTLSHVTLENNTCYDAAGLSAHLGSGGGSVELDYVVAHDNTASAAVGGLSVALAGAGQFDLRHGQVYANHAYEGGGVYLDGTFGSFGHANIEDTEIYSNTAGLSAGLENHAGDATAPVTLVRSRLHDNHAAFQGGGMTNYSALTITDSTLDANIADMQGGGIFNEDGAVLDIEHSTLSRNSSLLGGGIYSDFFIHSLGIVRLTNSTVSGNSAGQDGAGVYVKGGTLLLSNATVADNHIVVPIGTSYAGMGGGVYVAASGSENMENALLGNNTHRYGALPPEPDDCYGFLNSLGYNLIEATSNCTISGLSGTLTGNVIGQDPLLGLLQDNGGPTQTQALLAGSPAIDAGNPSGCTDLTTDQRGYVRPAHGRCDMGAYEYAPPNYYTVVPCRLVDTRRAAGPLGGPPLAAGDERQFTLADVGGPCGIPSQALAVSINVTVTQASAAGDLRVYPAGTTPALVSTINFGKGQTRANNAVVGLSGSGAVTIRDDQAAGNSVQMILDVNGYFQ